MIDVEKKLEETNLAIQTLKGVGHEVPAEAYEIQELTQRCAVAERLVAEGVEGQLHLGRQAYEAYSRHTGGKSLATGADLPTWDALPEPIRQAWIVAAARITGIVFCRFGAAA